MALYCLQVHIGDLFNLDHVHNANKQCNENAFSNATHLCAETLVCSTPNTALEEQGNSLIWSQGYLATAYILQ